MRICAAVFALTVVAASFPARPADAGPWLPAPGEYYSEFTAGRAVADTYVDDAGGRQLIPFGGSLESRSLKLYNEIGWKKSLSVVLAAPIVSISRRLDGSFGFAERTETGLGDLRVGFRYRVLGGAMPVALEADWDAPLGYQHNTAPALGPGRQMVGGKLLAGASLRALNTFVEASGGYRLEPEKDGGSEINASAAAGVWIGPSLLVSGRYSVAFLEDIPFRNDTEYRILYATATPPTISKRSHHDVSPRLLYRVDDRLDVFAGSIHTAAARNWIHADEFYVGVAFRQTKLNRLQGFVGNKSRP